MDISQCLWRPLDTIGCQFLGRSFIGGESIEEVLRTGEDLKKKGYKITYNLLGEHLRDPEESSMTHRKGPGKVALTALTIKSLICAMNSGNKGNVSIKPTQCGLGTSAELFYETAGEIIDRAKEAGIEVEFDAESRRFIPDTFRIFSAFASKFHYKGFVRQTVQAHLADIFDLMDEYDLWGKHLRVVKGSGVYPEAPGVILQDPDKVLEQYYHIARRNHAEGQVPYVATMRDRNLVRTIGALRDINIEQDIKKILPTSPYMLEFEMLYGPLGTELGEELLEGKDLREGPGGLDTGWPVRIYIPFVVDWCKDEWKTYGLRRSAMMRNLIREDKESRHVIFQEAKSIIRDCWEREVRLRR